jgi:RNA polymerase sigma-70 factor (ECF subfamily)
VIEASSRGHDSGMPDGASARSRDERTSQVTIRSEVPVSEAQRLTTMVEEHFDFVWRTLRRVGVPEADADDAAQEVFLVAARRLGDIELGRERAFLVGTAIRVASTRRRSARRRPDAPDERAADAPDPSPDPEALASRREARRTLDLVLDEMAEELRVVFVLFELEELAAPEIAALVGIPTGTVASRLRRARESFHATVRRLRAQDTGGGSL